MDGATGQWEESGCDFGWGLTRPRDSVYFLSPQPTFLLMSMDHFLSLSLNTLGCTGFSR